VEVRASTIFGLPSHWRERGPRACLVLGSSSVLDFVVNRKDGLRPTARFRKSVSSLGVECMSSAGSPGNPAGILARSPK